MGSCEYYTKCPKCGKDVCHIVYTRSREEYIGCLNPECNYGWKVHWVKVDGKMTLAIDMEKATFHFIPISEFENINDLLKKADKKLAVNRS